MEMDKFIEEELGDRAPDEVEELNIDSCTASHISGLTDKFINLQTLSIANSQLTSLKGFPSLQNLRKLDLSDNRISGDLDALTGCPKLEYIGLSGNPIKDTSCLEPLQKLENLQTLELFNCDIACTEKYRDKIFELLDNVLYVDGMDRNGQTAPDDDYDSGEDEDDEVLSNEEDDDEDSEGEGVPDEGEGSEDDEGSDDEDDEPHGTKRKHEDEENADDA